MTDTAAIARLIEPEVKALGFDLVRVAMIGGTSDPTLQVMAERPDTRQLTIDDCADLSRRLSEMLDAEEADGRDPIEGGYRLEGQLARHRPAADPPQGFRRLGRAMRRGSSSPSRSTAPSRCPGIIEGIDGDTIRIATPKGERAGRLRQSIASAKLLLTDRLITATAPLSTEGADTIKTEG